MKSLKKYIYLLLSGAFFFLSSSCVDDVLDPSEIDGRDPTVPKELAEGFSISFNVSLNAMGNESFSLSDGITKNTYLRELENFVDLEKLRILFFTCKESEDGSGKNDFFLFESKSRWVSVLTDIETTQANWQVTAPVFTYGNNDDYDWEAIRWALENHPFKIVILANRPDDVDFGNFDSKFDGEITFKTDRGPNWGPEQTYIYNAVNSDGVNWRDWQRRNKPEFNYYQQNEDYFRKKPTINSLHHCQWDPIYTSKNNGKHVYDFIIEKPWADEKFDYVNNKLKDGQFLTKQEGVGTYNLMGALSYWTKKKVESINNGKITYVQDPETKKDGNFYFHPGPDQPTKGIPMYGCQVFDKLTDWKAGTPYNVSLKLSGQSDQYERKNIHLLRSVVKIEFKIPRRMTKEDGTFVDLEVTLPKIHYTNVMARCEPLDVATPTEQLWKSDDQSLMNDYLNRCELENIMDYGPIIRENFNNENEVKGTTAEGLKPAAEYYYGLVEWFYGAWKDWWHFNDPAYNNLNGPESPGAYQGTYFGYSPKNYEGKTPDYPYPRIFNPVIQRNGDALIEDCQIKDDPDFYYYVIYTGEKNINDPSTVNKFSLSTGELVYFSFTIKESGKTYSSEPKYYIPLTDYSSNTILNNNYFTGTTSMTTYKGNMPGGGRNNWNWALLRNHVYTVTVTSFKDFMDLGAINSQIVSSENRYAPAYEFE
ncbi:MAG: hypothetical protein J1F67_08650 [Muribaculaceae bacterium]|nr:hypothetical protein [Muribaculaceae bacterium]